MTRLIKLYSADPDIHRIKNSVLPVRIVDGMDHPTLKQQRAAAVLIPLVMRETWQVILTLRPQHLPRHAGQISFPGGRRETGETSVQAALRETEEEIGIEPDAVSLIGRLPSFDSISDFRVTPFIGLIDPKARYTLDPNEVDDVFEVPLAFFMNARNHKPRTVEHEGVTYHLHDMPWKNRNVWGMTAMMLRQLYQRAYTDD